MFSRVGRLTTFGAHAITNCPFRRDKNCQPQKLAAPINDQISNFAHSFSDSIRTRNNSLGSDPFISAITDKEKEIIRELELLDLDSWEAEFNKKNLLAVKNEAKPSEHLPIPSSDIDFGDCEVWDTMEVLRNGTLPIESSPEKSSSNFVPEWDLMDFQALTMHEDLNLVQAAETEYKKQDPEAATATEEDEDTDLLDLQSWNAANKGENEIFVCGRNAKKILPEPKKSEIFNWTDNLTHNLVNPSRPEPSKLDLGVSDSSNSVDWNAWNKYLSEDGAQNAVVDDEPIKINNYSDYLSGFPGLEPDKPVEQKFILSEKKPQMLVNHHEIDDDEDYVPNMISINSHSGDKSLVPRTDYLSSSGPLLYTPPIKEEVVEVPRKMRTRRFRESSSPMSCVDSERSWTPFSEDFDDNPKFKKRGVVLKPSVDDETDRRRSLNRMAAVKYRERKRLEKQCRKKEFKDVYEKNEILRKQETNLNKEIQKMRQKLEKLGML